MTSANYTFREITEWISAMPEDKKDLSFTIHVRGVGEFYPVCVTGEAGNTNDVLDEGHPYVEI